MLYRLLILATVSFITSSCSPQMKNKLGLEMNGPDASNVAAHQRLKVPPAFYEKLPEPIYSDDKHIKNNK